MAKTGWRGSTAIEVAAGVAVGPTVALAPLGLSAAAAPWPMFAPVLSQALVTVGVSFAAFSSVSALRRNYGDPYGYGVWRAVGAGTALAVPTIGWLASARLPSKMVDFSLMAKCAPSVVLLACLGAAIQVVIDNSAHRDPSGKKTSLLHLALLGGPFLGVIGWQLQLLLAYVGAQRGHHGTLFSGSANSAALRQNLYFGSAVMAIVGAAIAAHAVWNHRGEAMRVGGLGFALSAIPVAFAAAAT